VTLHSEQVLAGFSGSRAIAIGGAVDAILRVGTLVLFREENVELQIDPVLVRPQGETTDDTRIAIGTRHAT
jgi:hypothetical protein